MREYIKKFNTAEAANGYSIVDIPFITSIATVPVQNLCCNTEGMKLVNDNGVIQIKYNFPDHTIYHYDDGTTEEIIAKGGQIAQPLSPVAEKIIEVDFGKDLTSIPSEFSEFCVNMRKATIPDTVTNIYDAAFGSNFTTNFSVEVPISVTDMSNAVFCSVKTQDNTGEITVAIKKLNIYPTIVKSSATTGIFGNILSLNANPTNIYIYDFDSAMETSYVQKLFMKGNNKSTYTYNVYTNIQLIKNALSAIADQYTIFNLYHLDGTSWS